jgi:hypothetical protein
MPKGVYDRGPGSAWAKQRAAKGIAAGGSLQKQVRAANVARRASGEVDDRRLASPAPALEYSSEPLALAYAPRSGSPSIPVGASLVRYWSLEWTRRLA